MKTKRIILIVLLAVAIPAAGQMWPIETAGVVDINTITDLEYGQWYYFDSDGARVYIKNFPSSTVGMYDMLLEIQAFKKQHQCDLVMDHTIWPSYADDIESQATSAQLGNGRMKEAWIMDQRWNLLAIANEEFFAIYISLKQ